MRKALIVAMAVGLAFAFTTSALAGDPACTTIKEGILTYSTGHYLEGQPFRTGFDPFGYNYQARKFMGSYANAYLGRDGFPPYEGDDEAYLAENPGAENHWRKSREFDHPSFHPGIPQTVSHPAGRRQPDQSKSRGQNS